MINFLEGACHLNYLKQSKLFYGLVLAISIGVMIWIYTNVSYIFEPLQALIGSIFVPLMIALFLYYTFLPIYHWLNKKIPSEKGALIVLLLIIIGVTIFFLSIIVPNLISQMESFIRMLPPVINNVLNQVETLTIDLNITTLDIYEYLQQLDISITNIATNVLNTLSASLTSIISGTISFFVVVATFPLFLIYMFKDGDKIVDGVLTIIPKSYQSLTKDVLAAAHTSARQYIGGRILIILLVAIGSYLSFLFIGLPNALFLGIMCGLFDIIPYFGPWIGAFPAFIVAAAYSLPAMILVVVMIFILQMIESYIITPFVMGNNLELHPVTVVILVLFAKNFIGIIGMILILPVFAIVKSIIQVVITYRHTMKQSDATEHK